MLCYVMLSYVMLCYVKLYYIPLFYIFLSYHMKRLMNIVKKVLIIFLAGFSQPSERKCRNKFILFW